MEFFDSHAHYNDEQFDEDREELLTKIYESGITKLISAGYSLESSYQATELAKQYSFIYAICGISPNDIPQSEEELWKQIQEIRNLVKQNEKIVAIGEIGLDYHWNKENKSLQKVAFYQQIKLANELELPIVIHTREAIQDTLEILKNEIEVKKKGVFHCCPLNPELVKEALKLGFFISFAGPVTFKNSKHAKEIVELVPLDKILIETDSPYLAPEPNRGKRNDSIKVKDIAKKIAEIKGISLPEVAKATYENTMKIFHIQES